MIQGIVKKGKVFGCKVSAPNVSNGSLLIKVVNSCISAGTEMSGVQASGKTLIKRALEQPEKIKKVIDMAKSDGIGKAYATIKGKLDTCSPTGYSIAGMVIATGAGVTKFKIGDNVAAAGAGLANHAEYVDVPENLVMKMPKGMSFKDASTVTLGGIAMQGVRRADLKFGEICVVMGSGILGLLSIQMLRLSGIRVIAVDLDAERLEIAKELGAEDVINPSTENLVEKFDNISGCYGADAVIFTAATSSSEPLSQAFKICRRKGKVIMVGVSGMDIKRSDLYMKELDLLMSTSYGPGRYDKNYEEKGIDYPYAYVRWTENRNMTEYLRLVHSGNIELNKLINEEYPIERVTEAFEKLKNPNQKPLMVLLDYGKANIDKVNDYLNHDRKIIINNKLLNKGIINVGLIGAGNFATSMHLPNIKKLSDKFSLHAVCSRTGLKAKHITEQYGAKYATTNINDILDDKDIDLVLISTRHDNHAELTIKALKANKHVFVEKPLAVTEKEIKEIESFYTNNTEAIKPMLFVGFNRRFSKYAVEIKKHVDKRINPMIINYRMNAGYIPLDHWIHEDGGREVGECCHIIDLMSFFTGEDVITISVDSLTPKNNKYSDTDNKVITLKYKDGSIAAIQYFANGSKELSKEYMEIHFDGKSITMDDYKSLKGFGIKMDEISSKTSEKGHIQELEEIHKVLIVENSEWPIKFLDLIHTSKIALSISEI